MLDVILPPARPSRLLCCRVLARKSYLGACRAGWPSPVTSDLLGTTSQTRLYGFAANTSVRLSLTYAPSGSRAKHRTTSSFPLLTCATREGGASRLPPLACLMFSAIVGLCVTSPTFVSSSVEAPRPTAIVLPQQIGHVTMIRNRANGATVERSIKERTAGEDGIVQAAMYICSCQSPWRAKSPRLCQVRKKIASGPII
jgi:hypothetical protein